MIRLSPVLLILVLSGCAATNTNVSGEWDCPAQQGRACTTIEEADSLSARPSVLSPAVSLNPLTPAPQVGTHTPTSALSTDASVTETADPTELVIEAHSVRRAEVLGKVWFYPFVDNANHYHEGGFVHVILRPGDWQTSPMHMFPAKTGARGMDE
jgi:type IV conjugative transfer system lipoprotein TraV